MPRQPIPLRKVPLIAKWSPEILADLLTKGLYDDDSYLLQAYEWVENHAARVVSPSTMHETLREMDNATNEHEKIALFPAIYFVWLDELEDAYQLFHRDITDPDNFTVHDALDLTPATGPFQDLLDECPNFSSNPFLDGEVPRTRIELRKRQTAVKHARWQARAEELHRDSPHQKQTWIAKQISREPIAEGASSETIRRKIRIR
jgi:hypothetical protein